MDNSLFEKNTYKGFDLIDVQNVPDCSSKGIFLRHRKTGLEVFHLLNDDKENLFAYAFRTPPESSNGAPHIIEHSVLCGSERYPLKDPFVHLINQSVKTFLNALTFPDKTVYPGSSVSETDYFNLMATYGDAVFFPTLRKEIFLQEGHHLEADSDGNVSIQGVVYNEMKGSYSSFNSVAIDAVVSAVLPDTVYALDSGGDPEEIQKITYEQFKDFHKKYYSPDNCLVFLYGNIPTEKQLDFLQEKILDRLESRFTYNVLDTKNKIDSILASERVKPFTGPASVKKTGPVSTGDTSDSTVVLSWLIGKSSDIMSVSECIFLSELLCGHDGAPLLKALVESGLGQDIAPICGIDSEMYNMIFTIGLRGVKDKDTAAVKELIYSKLKEIYENGLSDEDIESAYMGVDFSNREIRRSNGPYSLVLMRRALKCWCYGEHPASGLFYRKAFDCIKAKLDSDAYYIKKLIAKYFLDNMHCAHVVITPDEDFLKQRDEREALLIKELRENISIDGIKTQTELLHSFQMKKDENLECLPYIKPDDLEVYDDEVETEIKYIKSTSGNKIPYLVNREHTNGIVYADIAFPVDVLPSKYYPYLQFFSYAYTDMGWKDLDWAQVSMLQARKCGNFTCLLLTSSLSSTERAKVMFEKNRAFAGRQWIMFRIKMISEKTEDCFEIVKRCIDEADFDDVKHLKNLADEMYNDLRSSIVPSGHSYAAARAICTVNRSNAVDELWDGISQYYTMKHINENLEDMIPVFKEMKKRIFSSGCIFHVTSDAENLPVIEKCYAKLASDLNLEPPAPVLEQEDSVFYALTGINSMDPYSDEAFETPAQVGYVAAACECSPYGKKESIAETVFAHIISNTILWEKLRTVGGAYGAYASTDSFEGYFTVSTYRDPDPESSVDVIEDCLETAAQAELDDVSVEKAVTGTFSSVILPKSPSGRGFAGLMRELYCINKEDRLERQKNLLSVKLCDVKAAAGRILSFYRTRAKKVLILDKMKKLAGKIQKTDL